MPNPLPPRCTCGTLYADDTTWANGDPRCSHCDAPCHDNRCARCAQASRVMRRDGRHA